MDHNDIRHKLSEYIDNAIPPEEKAAIEAHLQTCTECSAALRELRKTIEHLHSIEEKDPPAWMTQKIMANVRAEANEKQSVFHRLFYPLAVKLPIQTVAVLFLAVTAFYIYRNIQPETRYMEMQAPIPELKQSAPAQDKVKGTSGKVEEVRKQREQAPQKPGYKSLDMKYEYEKPAAPVPQEQAPAPAAAAPAPMKKELSRSAKDEATLDKYAAQPKAKTAAPSVMAEQAGRSANLVAKEEAKPSACLTYEADVVTVSGVISKQDFPGPPNYESIAHGDKKETYWILKLDKPVCVTGKTGDDLNVSEAGITEMQLVLNSDGYAKYRNLLTKPVIVKGTLFHAITGHHNTQVLLTVQDITEKR